MSEEKSLVTNELQQNLPITSEKIGEYLRTFGMVDRMDQNQIDQFINVAKEFQLNPFKREIYCVAYRKKDGTSSLSIITGFEVYLKRAERSGLLKGWSVKLEPVQYQNKWDTRAVITIHRKGFEHSFEHEVWMSEYHQNNSMWNSKPKTMLRKVVIAQGMRLAFPCEFGGMPYDSSELPEEMISQKKADATEAEFKRLEEQEAEKIKKEEEQKLSDAIKNKESLITNDLRLIISDYTEKGKDDKSVEEICNRLGIDSLAQIKLYSLSDKEGAINVVKAMMEERDEAFKNIEF